jgi:ribosome-associated heat shock protein Hsp15
MNERDAEDRLRIDRWLWCARLFKTRTLAASAVKAGHVRLNGQRVKAAHDVKLGDAISILSDSGSVRDVIIEAIPLRRGPAVEALACYAETAESTERRRVEAERRALAPDVRPPTAGRPDKRTRRLLLRARQREPFNSR